MTHKWRNLGHGERELGGEALTEQIVDFCSALSWLSWALGESSSWSQLITWPTATRAGPGPSPDLGLPICEMEAGAFPGRAAVECGRMHSAEWVLHLPRIPASFSPIPRPSPPQAPAGPLTQPFSLPDGSEGGWLPPSAAWPWALGMLPRAGPSGGHGVSS